MQTAFIRTLVSSYFLSRSFKLGANSIQENIWKEIIYERLPKKKLLEMVCLYEKKINRNAIKKLKQIKKYHD